MAARKNRHFWTLPGNFRDPNLFAPPFLPLTLASFHQLASHPPLGDIMTIPPPRIAENVEGQAIQASFWENLFNSIFSPEYNTVPQKIMNFSFYGLFIVLAFLIFITNYNPHVIALFTLSIGLFISVNW